mmetsp:Transcript_15941/g.46112  ORF Transcript_15941/g.46112 Transcript_15941/m.46112 type:complete len:204 (-) Transcript_15941:319-930(-)
MPLGRHEPRRMAKEFRLVSARDCPGASGRSRRHTIPWLVRPTAHPWRPIWPHQRICLSYTAAMATDIRATQKTLKVQGEPSNSWPRTASTNCNKSCAWASAVKHTTKTKDAKQSAGPSPQRPSNQLKDSPSPTCRPTPLWQLPARGPRHLFARTPWRTPMLHDRPRTLPARRRTSRPRPPALGQTPRATLSRRNWPSVPRLGR